MPRLGLRVLSGLQVAALRALVRATAEEGARGTAVLVASGEGVDLDKPMESIEATSRVGSRVRACKARRRPFYATVSTNGEEC